MIRQELQVDTGKYRDLSKRGVWTVSTAKPGNGVGQLLDNNEETFWQSDGPQPHAIDVQFHRVVNVKYFCIFLDYTLDESYTPQEISILTATDYHHLQEVRSVLLEEPCGWVTIDLTENDEGQPNTIEQPNEIEATHLRLSVHANHQNGKDSHIRQIKIFGPISGSIMSNKEPIGFTSNSFAAFEGIR
eukprot:gb/GECH01010469.1/.p1 GENE.gb/GECH01010469.1/~~gb/GECH01010469.1/.p1  ORF type:complete len:188 (+),score=46.09 gb/GECH01010469.1/:1-564(+)